MTDESDADAGAAEESDRSSGTAPGADDGAGRASGSVADRDGSGRTAASDGASTAGSSDGAGTSDGAETGDGDASVGASGVGASGGDGGSTLVDDEVTDPSSIDPTELTLPERSLHPRIRVLWVLRAVLVAAVVGGIAVAGAYVLERDLVLGLGVGVVVLVLGVVFAVLRYGRWRYAVREDALYLERGVITHVRTVVPLVRIQHVDTRRGPVERAAGLATVVVYTAGSRGADVAIPGVSAERADDLQRRLKRLAIASEADTSV